MWAKRASQTWETVQQESKRVLERRFHVTFETMKEWNKKRAAFQEFVATHKIGKHGLLPVGSRGMADRASRSQGMRLQDPEKAKKRPLHEIYERMKKWLSKEREYNHEVRTSHLTERFYYEAEFERDRHLVYQQVGDEKFRPETLRRLQEILEWYQMINPTVKQKKWFAKCVLPKIGARLRGTQRLHDKPLALDPIKAKLSWETSDWFQDLIARSVPEELAEFVSDPKAFAEHKHETSYVVMDQTALWLKSEARRRSSLAQTRWQPGPRGRERTASSRSRETMRSEQRQQLPWPS